MKKTDKEIGKIKKTALNLHLHSDVDKLFRAFPVNGAQKKLIQ